MRAAAALALAVALAAPARAAKPSAGAEASRLFREGMAAKMRGETSKALEAFTAAMELKAGLPGLHLARGLTYLDAMMASSRYELHRNAEKDLVAAVEQAPKNPLALSALALARAVNGDRRGELDVQRAAAARENLPAYGWAAVGRLKLDQGAWKDAVAAYRKAYETSPQDHPLREWIRREMLVVKDRSQVRRRGPEPEKPAAPEKFDPAPYVEDLASEDAKVRAAAARALGKAGLEEMIDPLAGLLKDADLEVRATALQSLGRVGEPRAVSRIVPFLSNESKYMRALAARALGSIGSERARKPLEELLRKEKDSVVIADAKAALKEIDNAAFNLKMDMELLMEELAEK